MQSQRRALIGGIVACLVAIPVMWLRNQQPGQLAFYKLSLHWPTAACTGVDPPLQCSQPYLRQFRIHGFWPTDSNDNDLMPYDPQNPCVTVQPIPEDDIWHYIRQETEEVLFDYWPNLQDYQHPQANLWFWQQEWRKHGMCSDWPRDPDSYFKATLTQAHGFCDTLLDQLTAGGYVPTYDGQYRVDDISNYIYSLLNVYPEIACNQNMFSRKQLWEIRLCYEWDKRQQPPKLVLRHCPKRFSKDCKQNDMIWFFPVPAIQAAAEAQAIPADQPVQASA